MSITFSIRGHRHQGEGDCEICERDLNLANMNALDLLVFLGLEPENWGEMRASTLAARCRAALSGDRPDPALEPWADGRVVYCGREPGYLHDRARRLLELAELAGELGVIQWW